MFKAAPSYSPLSFNDEDTSGRESLETQRGLLSDDEKDRSSTGGQGKEAWRKTESTPRIWQRVCYTVLALSLAVNVFLLVKTLQRFDSVFCDVLQVQKQPIGVLPVSDFGERRY